MILVDIGLFVLFSNFRFRRSRRIQEIILVRILHRLDHNLIHHFLDAGKKWIFRIFRLRIRNFFLYNFSLSEISLRRDLLREVEFWNKFLFFFKFLYSFVQSEIVVQS